KVYDDNNTLFFDVKVFEFTPRISNPRVSPSTGGWGELFNFSVTVYDEKGRNVTVYLWEKPAGTDNWDRLNSTLTQDCSPNNRCNVSLTYDGYIPANISTRDFKFNATNRDGSNTTATVTFTVERDDVNAFNINPANNVIVNRSERTNFTVRVYDRDNESYPSGARGKVYMSAFGSTSTFDDPSPIFTNATGYFVRTFRNTTAQGVEATWCQSKYNLGPHAFKGGTEGGSVWKDNITGRRNVTLYGGFRNTLREPDGDQNYTRQDSPLLSGFTTNFCGSNVTEHVTFTYNVSTDTDFFQCSNANEQLSGDLLQCDFTIPDTAPYGWYNVSFETNKTYYHNDTVERENAFYLSDSPAIFDPGVSPQSDGWGRSPFNFTVNLTDQDPDVETVYFWVQHPDGSWELNQTATSTTSSNREFLFKRNFSRTDVGTWSVKFNVTDTSGNSNETRTVAFTVEKDDIRVELVRGTASAVNRSDAELNNAQNLTAKIFDLDRDTYTTALAETNVTLALEQDTSTFDFFAETNNGTHYKYELNPGCGFTVGR
ncbi:MAG: hypothetical protein SVU32_08215, partial [Candidatus Nanohaloarchaea archaeon]|nr:hypothetical protein [Candidatus Nanohaloarchaea archaeon]